jgi:hypothetical protein
MILRLCLPGIILLAAAGILVACSSGDDRETYRNEALGYQLSYPSSWQLDILSPSATTSRSRGPQEYVRVTGPDSDGAPSVVVAVNFDARWCETGLGQEVSVVYVSGVAGEEYVCSLGEGFACRPVPACRDEPYQLVWNFPGERGRLGFVVMGTPGNDLDAVRKVFASFQFSEP